ncbi:hypothetical protein ACFVIM_09365 [Streptomyces sp. NPDC057638]|uniref:hypothetical protein n=1 Tax=Streptomyces sp. NPDC057638 TaxID=3346190 RepID=UPI003683D08F
MSLRTMFATAGVVATLAGAGLAAAPAAQAAPTDAPALATAAGPTGWVDWGTYPDLTNCRNVGDWMVRNGGASNYLCSPLPSGGYLLSINRP